MQNKIVYPMPIQVSTRAKALVCGPSVAGMASLNSAGSMVVSCECCVLSDRGLCLGLITRQEQPYRMCCVCV